MDGRLENIVARIVHYLQKVPIPGTHISLYNVLVVLWKKIITFDIDQRAAAVSFSLILAVFPGIIFIFTLIPYLPIDNLDELILEFLRNILPKGIYQAVANTITDIISRKRVDVLSFGFFFTVFAATNGMMALMRAFNMALKKRDKRSYLKARGVGLLLTALLVFTLIFAVAIIIVGQIFLGYLLSKNVIGEDINLFIIQILRYISVFAIFFIGICCIYYFAPAIRKKLKFFSVGAGIASILCILATNLFSYYLVNFNSYNRLYGSIGTFIGVMVWIYLISLILIFGFEVNISVRDAISEDKTAKTPQQSSARGV
ncbi:membrane protein [Spirosomataceae bacterium TFI 002]|nr:membrane protein [Spirosomataceae bacterium TFI 002]